MKEPRHQSRIDKLVPHHLLPGGFNEEALVCTDFGGNGGMYASTVATNTLKPALFSLKLRAKKDVASLKGLIQLQREAYSNLAFDAEGNTNSIDLIFCDDIAQNSVDLRVFPNPSQQYVNLIYPAGRTSGLVDF